MPITRFSLSALPDLADPQRATILHRARAADFPLISLLSSASVAILAIAGMAIARCGAGDAGSTLSS